MNVLRPGRGVRVVHGAARRWYVRRASEQLFRDAEKEESVAQQNRNKMPNIDDPIWTGEERLEDAVLRMLMDKYKPLRSGTPGTAPVKEKLQKVQKPTELPLSSRQDSPKPSKPFTPEGQPWNAVFVTPTHARTDSPKVYRGRYLNLEPPKSDMAKKLNSIGLSPSQLPVANRSAMTQVRQSLSRAVESERLEHAIQVKLNHTGKGSVTAESEQQHRPLIAMAGAVKGIAGLAEQKIEEAKRRGVFERNSLRGKPLTAEHYEGNPHLGREEFFLNRIVQRQGSRPPWVELHVEVKTEEMSLRQQIQHAWLCRALMQLDASNVWRQMHPVAVEWGRVDPQTDRPTFRVPESEDAGQKRLLTWAQEFRDPEWVRREASFHAEAVHQLNQVIRRYNQLAPYTGIISPIDIGARVSLFS
ncbi:hypothetical protein MNAN1_002305 [Malassezia nana]|uniref:DnaJ homologue subfamily C member 28 conserved domain-containing protein n=1 Tax=Malassezia nana TaxID=180528 RepID=A0AAF0J2W2_9BASI|nr:hypothetical protein MNAN1_002305 [Malassezia nana]